MLIKINVHIECRILKKNSFILKFSSVGACTGKHYCAVETLHVHIVHVVYMFT